MNKTKQNYKNYVFILPMQKKSVIMNNKKLEKIKHYSEAYLLKVSKSQRQFFLKLHCPKNERNIRQNSAL
jgi:hypothetical protein